MNLKYIYFMFCLVKRKGNRAGTGRADAEGRVGPVVNSLPAVMPLTMGIGAMFKWWANEDKK
ncbi:hypothetical protein JKF61_18575 [Klebsiella quasipneumoniae]|uniref:hypothetical protein n=1 Tax=Klebsiella pneumoniae complex TaxID=3390273 RepID=UPI000E3E3F96|nr:MULTISPECIES: hypothetical protein [Klebsiella]EKZ5698357.1 hypothetical protein [Klebsiella quasipneumoniae]MCU4144429.1 hypothetical protein [Klebsiella quasipneumoniae]MCU4147200.1 hypothetical protein [Klebsiella quasipneumoniae]MEC5757067.1 hypothetical protein [Klebsiella pneumoniae]HBR5855401.1 hypothetical protein [Klebsiella pneumoniae]